MAFERIIPQDIKFEFEAEKLSDIRNILEDQMRLSLSEILFILALFGLQEKESHPLEEKSGVGEYTFSRTVYSRNSTLLDTYYGLITILANKDSDYDEVINNMAFCKNADKSLRFTELTNVKTFYSYFLGGIRTLYKIINEYDRKSEIDVFDSLYDFILDDDEHIECLYDELKNKELSEEQ